MVVLARGQRRRRVDARLADAARAGHWTGRANRLSPDHVPWDWIDVAAEASRVVEGGRRSPTSTMPLRIRGRHRAPVCRAPGRLRAGAIAAASRCCSSAGAPSSMDGASSIDLDRFLVMMRRLLPDAGVPFDALATEPRVHLALFVHRVHGLEPGIYALARSARGLDVLREAMRPTSSGCGPRPCPTTCRCSCWRHSTAAASRAS